MEELAHTCDTDGSKMVHFQKRNLKYLKLTNFPGYGTTENEIYVKFCFRKSLLENDSIVDNFLQKPGRFSRDFAVEVTGG